MRYETSNNYEGYDSNPFFHNFSPEFCGKSHGDYVLLWGVTA